MSTVLEEFELEKFGRHVPRILIKQLCASYIESFLDESTEQNASDDPECDLESCQPSIQRFYAALLFIDISGFTVLSQRLSVEELRTHINAYFKRILDIVQTFGGDVVKFAGDALFIVWPTEPQDNESFVEAAQRCTRAALSCGTEVNAQCSNYRIDFQPSSTAPTSSDSATHTFLNVHSGMSFGLFAGMDVGSLDRWEYLITGPPIEDVAQAEGEAGKGELSLSPLAHSLVCGAAGVLRPYDTSALGTATVVDCGCTRTPGGCYQVSAETLAALSAAAESESCPVHFLAAPHAEVLHEKQAELPPALWSIAETAMHAAAQTYADAQTRVQAQLLPLLAQSAQTNMQSQEEASVALQGFFLRGAMSALLDDTARHVHEADRWTFRLKRLPRRRGVQRFVSQMVVDTGSSVRISVNGSGSFVSRLRQSVSGTSPTSPSSPALLGTSSGEQGAEPQSLSVKVPAVLLNGVGNTPVNGTRRASVTPSAASVGNSSATGGSESALAGELRKVAVLFVAIKHSHSNAAPSFINNNNSNHGKFLEVYEDMMCRAVDSQRGVIDCELLELQPHSVFVQRCTAETRADTQMLGYFQHVMSVVVRGLKERGGQLRQFIVDDKGTVCIGTLGLRGSSSSDNAASAVEAARTIIDLLPVPPAEPNSTAAARLWGPGGGQRVEDLEAGVGITLGQAYCGLVGSPQRHEYAVMGPSVNLSARLMARTQAHEIYVDRDTRAGSRFHAFLKIAEIAAKGFAMPVPIYQPLHTQNNNNASSNAISNNGSSREPQAQAMQKSPAKQRMRAMLVRQTSTLHAVNSSLSSSNHSITGATGGNSSSNNNNNLLFSRIQRRASMTSAEELVNFQSAQSAALDALNNSNISTSGKINLAADSSNADQTQQRLFGREAELDYIVNFCVDVLDPQTDADAASESGDSPIQQQQQQQQLSVSFASRALVLEGPSGVGKSELLYAAHRAVDTCVQMLLTTNTRSSISIDSPSSSFDASSARAGNAGVGVNVVAGNAAASESVRPLVLSVKCHSFHNVEPFHAWKRVVRSLVLHFAKFQQLQQQRQEQKQAEQLASVSTGDRDHEEDDYVAPLLKQTQASQKSQPLGQAQIAQNLGEQYKLGLALIAQRLSAAHRPLLPLLVSAQMVPGHLGKDLTQILGAYPESGSESLGSLSGPEKLRRFGEMLGAVVRDFSQCTGRALFLLIDDMHCLDLHSWTLLWAVVREGRGTVLLGTFCFNRTADASASPATDTPDPDSQALGLPPSNNNSEEGGDGRFMLPQSVESTLATQLAQLERSSLEGRFERLELSLLHRGALLQMLCSLLGPRADFLLAHSDADSCEASLVSAAAHAFCDLLEEVSGGNPLYVYEIARCLDTHLDASCGTSSTTSSTAVQRAQEETCQRLCHAVQSFHADRLDEVVLCRFDRLSVSAQTLLKLAAVCCVSDAHRGFTAHSLVALLRCAPLDDREVVAAPGDEDDFDEGLLQAVFPDLPKPVQTLEVARRVAQELLQLLRQDEFLRVLRVAEASTPRSSSVSNTRSSISASSSTGGIGVVSQRKQSVALLNLNMSSGEESERMLTVDDLLALEPQTLGLGQSEKASSSLYAPSSAAPSLSCVNTGNAVVLDFKIALERNAVYSLMLASQRRAGHAKVALALLRAQTAQTHAQISQIVPAPSSTAASNTESVSVRWSELFFHAQRGGLRLLAVRAASEAAKALDALGAFDEAAAVLFSGVTAYRQRRSLVLHGSEAVRGSSVRDDDDYVPIPFAHMLPQVQRMLSHPARRSRASSVDGAPMSPSVAHRKSINNGVGGTPRSPAARVQTPDRSQTPDKPQTPRQAQTPSGAQNDTESVFALRRESARELCAGSAQTLQLCATLLLRAAQASFSLSHPLGRTSRLYEEALELLLVTWRSQTPKPLLPDAQSLERASLQMQDSLCTSSDTSSDFAPLDPSVVFPVLAGLAARYRMRRLRDDAQHSQEHALYSLMHLLATSSPTAEVHRLQALCLLRSIQAELRDYSSSLHSVQEVLATYVPRSHSSSLVAIYGNDRGPHTLSLAAQDLLLLGRLHMMEQLVHYLRAELLPQMEHLHSAGILVLPLSPLLVLLGRPREAHAAFDAYFQLQEQRGPKAYSFFRQLNPLFRLYLGLCAQNLGCIQQWLGVLLPQILDFQFLGSETVEARPLPYEAVSSFGLGVEFVCAEILRLLLLAAQTQNLSENQILGIRVTGDPDGGSLWTLVEPLLRRHGLSADLGVWGSAALRYISVSRIVCAASNRFAFSYCTTLLAQCKLLLLLRVTSSSTSSAVDTSEQEVDSLLDRAQDLAVQNQFPVVALFADQMRRVNRPGSDVDILSGDDDASEEVLAELWAQYEYPRTSSSHPGVDELRRWWDERLLLHAPALRRDAMDEALAKRCDEEVRALGEQAHVDYKTRQAAAAVARERAAASGDADFYI